jgi:hypothetical protein
MDVILKTAIGVLLAFTIVFFARVAYFNYFISEITNSVAEITNRQQERIEARKQNIIQVKRVAEMKERAEQVQVRRKELAWSKYYQQPEECLSYRSEEHMVECGNMRIRAKREFDRSWNEGVFDK